MDAPVAESRLPVGSSASQRGDGQPPPRGAAGAGGQQPVGDVAQDGLVLGEEELLEHEPDPGGAQRRQLPVAQRRDV